MDLLEQQELIDKMGELVKKWKIKPQKFSNEYWRYRADQNLWYALRQKLNSAPNQKTAGQIAP
jgi:hypothetical protein